MDTIGKFCLKNQGGFVVKMDFTYIDNNGRKIRKKGTGDITLGFSKTADPGAYGVPDGAMVSIYCDVVWGTDNQGNEMFYYKKGCSTIANYVITGTTLGNTLGFTGFSSTEDTNALEKNSSMDFSDFTEDQISSIVKDLEDAPLSQSGSWGPISWEICAHFNASDFKKSYVDAKINFFGTTIISGKLDINNPTIVVDLTVMGVGVKAELGINIESREVYLKGSLNFVYYTKEFDLTLLKF